jgi:hypothetical protein
MLWDSWLNPCCASLADGCSEQCTVENGYACFGGGATSADTCVLPVAAPTGKEFVKATARLNGVTKEAFDRDVGLRQAFVKGVAEALGVLVSQVLIESTSGGQSRRSQQAVSERRQGEVCIYACECECMHIQIYSSSLHTSNLTRPSYHFGALKLCWRFGRDLSL